ncbi:hypothetical protein GCM10025868_06570 [Angustibacter aerolatus]|uniref:Cell division protein SepF n=1 Tax=Angustibacter aerolatus TaxID=1162965 RepID=A0ABQ6JB46_9ACTN|nr:hypothetical protein [Angustibacter aerolatus]GMA85407.1 hypothetical protein GCM10025868_06570 [Angustibacter aerolatus]
MAGALRKTMVYLGLAEEDDRYDESSYDAYDEYDQPEHDRREHHGATSVDARDERRDHARNEEPR